MPNYFWKPLIEIAVLLQAYSLRLICLNVLLVFSIMVLLVALLQVSLTLL